MIKHFLQNPTTNAWVEIPEPIGFDNFTLKIERDKDTHGISAEYSTETLEFIGEEVDIIKTAYFTNIDTKIHYAVEDNGIEIYHGICDLSTYSEVIYSDYCSVKVAVAEVGVKSKFNARTDIELDLETDVDIDGNTITGAPMNEMMLELPKKELVYTNLMAENSTPQPITKDDNGDYLSSSGVDEKGSVATLLSLDTQKTINNINEFGSFSPATFIRFRGIDRIVEEGFTGYSSTFNASANWQGSFKPIFQRANSITEKQITNVKINTKLKFSVNVDIYNPNYNKVNYKLWVKLLLLRKNEVQFKRNHPSSQMNERRDFLHQYSILAGNNQNVIDILQDKSINYWTNHNGNYVFNFDYNVSNYNYSTFENDDELFLAVLFKFEYEHSYFLMETGESFAISELCSLKINSITFDPTSYFEMKGFSNAIDNLFPSKILPIYEVIRKCVKKMANVDFISNWYNRTGTIGGGAMKGLTNGYKIRVAPAKTEEQKHLKLTFKKLFNSLNAIDGLGYGWEKDGNKNVLRVENWKYFYKNNVVLKLENVKNIERTIFRDYICNQLVVGYKKFVGNEEIHAIDTFHSERTFVSKQNAVSGKLELLSEFIADPYAIELTRRQNYRKETTDWKYDEDIFIIELYKENNDYKVVNGVQNEQNIFVPTELTNPTLSPKRNALRNKYKLFNAYSPENFNFESGKINNFAAYKNVMPSQPTGITRLYDVDVRGVPSVVITENSNIEYVQSLFTAELLNFECPLTIEQYNALKNDPYALIEVNGIKGWLNAVEYDFSKREAKFKLLPKRE